MKNLHFILLITFNYTAFAQISIGNVDPNPYSQLDISADNKGLLIPRVALQNLTDSRPISENTDELPESLLIFNTNATTDLEKGYYFWNGEQWNKLATQTLKDAGGDLSGTYPNPNVIKLRGIDIDPIEPVAGQVLQYDGTNWVPVNMPSSSINRIFAGQATIPPHAENSGSPVSDWTNFTNTNYNNADWKIFSKTSTLGTAFIDNVISPPKMVLVYEYTGIPFDLVGLTPFLTIGNNSSWPDTFVATFINLEEVAGKTRLKVAVSRTDRIGLSDAAWGGSFLINILLVN